MADASLEDLIKYLDLAGKGIAMYSETHPSAVQYLDQAFALLNNLLQTRSNVNISIAGTDALIDGVPVRRKDMVVERFAKSLDSRMVRSLNFVQGLTRQELTSALRLLNMAPQKIRDMGGLGDVLEKEGIRNVNVGKVKYGVLGQQENAGSDQSLLAQLLAAVQTSGSDVHGAALNLENSAIDPTAIFQLFQGQAQKTPPGTDSGKPVRDQFIQMFRSFSPAMQGKLLTTALLNRSLLDQSSLTGFYAELDPAELEAAISSSLEQSSEQEQKRLLESLAGDSSITLTGVVAKRVAEFRESAARMAEDPEKIPELIAKAIAAGNLEEADRLSKKILSLLNAPQSEERVAAIQNLPATIEQLVKHEKWKNAKVSLTFLLSNYFRKETSDDVLSAYADFWLDLFHRRYLAKDMAGCREIFGIVSSRPDKKEAVAASFVSHLMSLQDGFKQELVESTPQAEMVMQYLKHCGRPGADYLLEWLAQEEEQRSRSRLINCAEGLEKSSLLPEIEQRLGDSRWFVVRNMITILARLEAAESVKLLNLAVHNPDARVAKEIVKILFNSVVPENATLVLGLLQHPDKTIRFQALKLATVFGLQRNEAKPLLQKMASQDPAPEVRALAASMI